MYSSSEVSNITNNKIDTFVFPPCNPYIFVAGKRFLCDTLGRWIYNVYGPGGCVYGLL